MNYWPITSSGPVSFQLSPHFQLLCSGRTTTPWSTPDICRCGLPGSADYALPPSPTSLLCVLVLFCNVTVMMFIVMGSLGSFMDLRRYPVRIVCYPLIPYVRVLLPRRCGACIFSVCVVGGYLSASLDCLGILSLMGQVCAQLEYGNWSVDNPLFSPKA